MTFLKNVAVLLVLAVLMISLSACHGDSPREILTPVIVPKQRAEYVVPKLTLLPVNIDAPRDMTKLVLKPDANAECSALNANTDDAALRKRCLHNPIKYDGSNLYRGYTRDDWDNFRINETRKDEYIKTLLRVVNDINSRIANDNEEAKKALQEIQNSTNKKADK
jgi:hypothetical protein